MSSPTDSGTVLVTKVQAPPPRDLVPRPALVERLASAPPRRLSIIEAQAGWGKTTLLTAWATSPAERRPFAWLQLDPADDEPTRFWRYVVAALRTLDPRLGAPALELLAVPGVDTAAEVVPRLINDLAESGLAAVLVLDDFHVVSSTAIRDGVQYLVERLPPGTEVAIASRTRPPLALGRLRARGELLEVGEAHLRFSPGEAASLLNRVVNLGLTDRQLDMLHRRTEGWAAGLYLAALSLRDRADRDAFIEAFSGSDRLVVDYLADEVIAGLDDDVRTFLVRTSVLDRLTGPVCDAVAGTTDGAARLRAMERSNLFLVPLDDRREVYRYHHLFGDLLRRELDPALAAELHARAFAHLLSEGDVDRAIRHAVAAGQVDAAVELIVEHWPSWLLARGEHGAIDAWLQALPREVVERDPRLCVAMTFTGHSLGRAHEVRPWIERAEQLVDDRTPTHVRLDVAAARASNALQTGDVDTALAAATRALALGDVASPWVALPHGVRAHALRWSGDTEGAHEAFGDWLEASAARGLLLGVVHSHASLALLAAEAGDEEATRRHAEAAFTEGADRFAEHWVSLDAHVALALLDRDRGHAARLVALAERGGVPGDRANALLVGADVLADPALVGRAREVLAGCPAPGGLVLERLAAAERRREEPGEGEELSEREREVLRLLASELTQREIGEALYVSMNTVKTHVRHVCRKLGASGREDAVARARERGLLSGRGPG